MSTDERPVPPITPGLRETARQRPNSWLYAIDPAFDPRGQVPPYGIVGAWWVDERGEITGEFQHNPNYRPSPKALELPAPRDPLEDALQRAATGYAPEGELLRVLVGHPVVVFAGPENSFFSVTRPDGRKVVQAFSSEAVLPPGEHSWQTLSGGRLAGALPEHELHLNPGTATAVTIPLRDVAAAAGHR